MANNISANKLFYNCESVANRTPITADIFLDDYCNNRCPYCAYARYGERNGQYVAYEGFVHYVRVLQERGVKGFILTGGGEPTISKDFDKIVKWLEQEKIDYGINTNFNVLKLIQPRYLKISLDGWDEDSYEAKRGVRRYEKTVHNIETYLEWKRQNGVKTSVGIQLVATSVDEVKRFYDAHNRLSVDYMNFRPVESTMAEYYADKDEHEILNYLEELRERDSRVIINYKWYNLREKFARCYAHFAQVAINQRGELMYCCHKPYEVIGHIDEPGIWEKYKDAVTNMRMCDVPCRLTAPNKFVSDIEENRKDVAFI